MSLGKVIIAGVIASIGIFAAAVIQNEIIIEGGWSATFTGSEILVAPAIIGAAVFVSVLGKLQTIHI